MHSSQSQPDISDFAAEFRYWLDVSGYSRNALGKKIKFERSYISKVASGKEPGSLELIDAADYAMNAGGALIRAWKDTHHSPKHSDRPAAAVPANTTALRVRHDHARLYYEQGKYRLTQRRLLVNNGDTPITQYLIRISVDRYPGQPELSNSFYRERPLQWDVLTLRAWLGPNRETPLKWKIAHDRDSFKEVWVRFEGQDGQQLPLYPGQETWLEYEYTVGDDQWGNWYRRAVRLPTDRLSVELDFPTATDPTVWGLHTSTTGDGMPLETPIVTTRAADRTTYSWSTSHPQLHSRYTLEWKFRRPSKAELATELTPSEKMAQLGIVQLGNDILRTATHDFHLPDEADAARRLIEELDTATQRVATAHTFSKGMGIAAPQIGVSKSAAIIHPPGQTEPIILFNPRIIDTSTDQDTQYEGCLSFFDTRSYIPRPLAIDVEHTDLDGTQRITRFLHGLARLVAHEIDHLNATLCTDHLPEGKPPTPLTEYNGTGKSWNY